MCYNNCSENNNSKIYSYQDECVSQCPEKYILNKYNICVINENKFEDNIKKLINIYNNKSLTSKSNIEVEEIVGDIILSCHSCNTDLNDLIHSNPNLMFINLRGCIDILKKEFGLDENSDFLIIEIQPLNGEKEYINYEIYTRNGEKINNLSSCENIYIQLSLPINNTLKNYEEAIILAEQGYDIYNLSSEFYTDTCLSASINDSDLTLSLRQNEIYPGNESLCLNNCIYDGINLEENRVNCLCNIYLSDDMEINEGFFETVEQNFFYYLASLINYQIIKCFKLIFDKKNYINNYGFYINGFLFFLVTISMFLYHTIGKKEIRIEYFRKRPKINNLNNKNKDKNNIFPFNISDRDMGHKFVKPKKYINKLTSKKVQQIKKPNNLKISNKTKSNPQKKKKNKKFITDKNLAKFTSFKNRNIRPINKEFSSGKLNIRMNNSSTTQHTENIRIRKSVEIPPKKENEDSIDYNELPFFEAFKKDKRNIIEIFLSYFCLKMKTIQIFFFRNEFTHFSLSFSFYVFEILLDITINSLLFTDDVISEKYFNNGELLLITENMLSISSNIISYFILLLTEKLINQNLVYDNITKEIKDSKNYYKIFAKLTCCLRLKLTIFYSILLFIGLFCTYYLFIFCAIFHKIQKNLFVNYILSSLWSLGFTVFICLFVTITRKISINKRNKKLYIISKFIDEKF